MSVGEPNPVRALQEQVEQSDGWAMESWADAALVLSRAGLKHMLSKVEREMGKRQLIAPHRETR